MKYIYLLIGIVLFQGCNDVEREPIAIDKVAPGQITNVNVIPTPGGANITYDLPLDMDLLYIEARYTLPNGKNVLINSSNNKRTLSIEGFAEIKEYEVALTSVDRSGNKSEPYLVNITPDTPPVVSVFNTIKIQPDFGGLNLQWDNASEAELAILIYKKNEDGENENIDTYYSSSKNGNYSVRGLDDVEGEFTIQLRDKWNNFSEKCTKTLTPLYETQISADDLKLLDYAYTSNLPMSDMAFLPRMWNGELYEKMVTENSKIPWYASFTVADKPIRLSRFVLWQFSWPFNNYGHYYAGNNGSLYEIYGSADEVPTVDMSGWTLLQTCKIVKPSGLPFIIGRDNMSEEDFDLAHNRGHEFILPLDAPAVRHLRIRAVDCFGGVIGSFAELQIFGDPGK